MARRIRLTDKRRRRERKAVEENIPYPGTVNQPDRTFKRRDQYDNYEEVVNHPLPDMRTEWRDDARDEIGFGIPEETTVPTVASIRSAASKAVKLAVLLLGEKVDEDVVEAQARDFMRLGNKALGNALKRFAETEKLYSQDDDEEEEAQDEDEEKKSKKSQDEEEVETAEETEEVKASEEEEKASEETEVEASEEDGSKKSQDDEDEDEDKDEDEEKKSKKSQDDDDDDDDDDEDEDEDEDKKSKKSQDEEGEEEVEDEPATVSSAAAELDIEVTPVVEEVESDPEAEALLAQVFSDGEAEVESSDETEEAKQGIEKLGGQPKFASDMSDADISTIWQDAPDVSDVFK
jgi:hypothetical protein